MIKPFKKLVHLGKVHMMPRESFSLAQQKNYLEVEPLRWLWAEAQKPNWQGSIATWKVVLRPESFYECYM